jgi:membrane associated rhomboid family serine protease
VTYTLLFLNILVFLAGLALAKYRQVPIGDYISGHQTPAVREIHDLTGFLSGEDVYVRGQWWRLITACFGHIGFVHLAVNMYSLFVVGPLLERIWGSGRFLVLYLISGLGGSCGMLLQKPLGGGAGASGALWGVMASFATWIYLNRHALPPALIASWRRSLLIVFILNVGITVGIPQVSKGAHFGGGIIGLVAGVPLDYLRFGRGWQRAAAFAGLIALPVLCLGILIQSFRYTGSLIQGTVALREAQYVYDTEARPLLDRDRRNRNAEEANRIADELAELTAQVKAAARSVGERSPWWIPDLSRDEQRFKEAAANDTRILDAGIDRLRGNPPSHP